MPRGSAAPPAARRTRWLEERREPRDSAIVTVTKQRDRVHCDRDRDRDRNCVYNSQRGAASTMPRQRRRRASQPSLRPPPPPPPPSRGVPPVPGAQSRHWLSTLPPQRGAGSGGRALGPAGHRGRRELENACLPGLRRRRRLTAASDPAAAATETPRGPGGPGSQRPTGRAAGRLGEHSLAQAP